MKNAGSVKLAAIAIAGAASASEGAVLSTGQNEHINFTNSALGSSGTAGSGYMSPYSRGTTVGFATATSLKDTKVEFERIFNQFMADTNLVSSIHTIMVNPNFSQLIGFGPKSVPWLLSRIEDSPMRIMPILSAITRENPIGGKDRGNVEKMTRAWTDWGKAEGLC